MAHGQEFGDVDDRPSEAVYEHHRYPLLLGQLGQCWEQCGFEVWQSFRVGSWEQGATSDKATACVLSDSVQVARRVVHLGDAFPVLPAIREGVRGCIRADVRAERRHQCRTQAATVALNERLEPHNNEGIPTDRIVTEQASFLERSWMVDAQV